MRQRFKGCLASLVRGARALDLTGLRQYFDRHPDGERTCFQWAKLLPAGLDLYLDHDQLQVCQRGLVEPPQARCFPCLNKC